MPNWGIKISNIGNVLRESLQNLGLTSKAPILNIVYSGTIKLVMAANGGSGTLVSSTSFRHGLGYIPIFLVYGHTTYPQNSLTITDFQSDFGQANNCTITARSTREELFIYGGNRNNVEITTELYYFIFNEPAD